MLRRTNPAAILRALLALCLAWPAAFPGEWADLGGGSTAPMRDPAGPVFPSTPRILARGGHDAATVTAAPGPEDRDVEDLDGPDAPRNPVAAVPPDPAAPWTVANAGAVASFRAPAGRAAPSPRLIAIRC